MGLSAACSGPQNELTELWNSLFNLTSSLHLQQINFTTMATRIAPQPPSPTLLTLPTELRLKILKYAFIRIINAESIYSIITLLYLILCLHFFLFLLLYLLLVFSYSLLYYVNLTLIIVVGIVNI